MSNHAQSVDTNIPKIIACIVGAVALFGLFTGIVQGIVLVFETLMPVIVFFCSAAMLLMFGVLSLAVGYGVRQASRGELGRSINGFSRGLRGLPPASTQPRISYGSADRCDDVYTIDAIPASPLASGTGTAPRFATVTSCVQEVPPSPSPPREVPPPVDEQHEILLLRAAITDEYIQHVDRIASTYPYEKFLTDIDSDLYFLAGSYERHLNTVRETIERALKIATIVDLKQEVVRAYNKAPRGIRSKLPARIVREHILTAYHQRFPLDLIRRRHRSLFQKIESVALQVKEAATQNPPAQTVDPRVAEEQRKREALKQACREQAEKNVRKVMPSTPRELCDDLVSEETKRLFQNAIQREHEQGTCNDRIAADNHTTAA